MLGSKKQLRRIRKDFLRSNKDWTMVNITTGMIINKDVIKRLTDNLNLVVFSFVV
jgi:hypothetical protein